MLDIQSVKCRGADVPVHFANPLDHEHNELVLSSPLFTGYLESVTQNAQLKSIRIADVTFFGRTHVGLLTLQILVRDFESGNQTRTTVWLRGDSVAILTILRTPVRHYVVLVRQLRLAAGGYLEETPAGMLDNGNLRGKAIGEMREELGLDITSNDLVPLGGGRLFTMSPGACDERMAFFVCVKDVDEAFIASINGRQTGVAAENEHIEVVVRPLDGLADITTDAKTCLALHLFTAN